jgi:hypothetical protein
LKGNHNGHQEHEGARCALGNPARSLVIDRREAPFVFLVSFVVQLGGTIALDAGVLTGSRLSPE